MPLAPSRLIDLSDIRVSAHVRESGDGPYAVFLHGFPAIASSLHHQFDAVNKAGWNCIAFDQRGFGASDCPTDVSAYAMQHLVSDVFHLLDDMEIRRAVLIGHDWGGAVAWECALARPHRIDAVVSLGTPIFPPPDEAPLSLRRKSHGEDNYVVAFQEPGRAEGLLDADIGRSIDFFYRKNYITMAQFAKAPDSIRRLELLKQFEAGGYDGEPVLTAEERSELIKAFERTSFAPGINWYRNIDQNWARIRGDERLVKAPSLIVSGADDYFAPPEVAAASNTVAPAVETIVVPGGHWFPLENPDQTNAAIVLWLGKLNMNSHGDRV